MRNAVRNTVALMPQGPHLTLLPRACIGSTSNPDFASRVSTAPNIGCTCILSTASNIQGHLVTEQCLAMLEKIHHKLQH